LREGPGMPRAAQAHEGSPPAAASWLARSHSRGARWWYSHRSPWFDAGAGHRRGRRRQAWPHLRHRPQRLRSVPGRTPGAERDRQEAREQRCWDLVADVGKEARDPDRAGALRQPGGSSRCSQSRRLFHPAEYRPSAPKGPLTCCGTTPLELWVLSEYTAACPGQRVLRTPHETNQPRATSNPHLPGTT
jgi:hypothetical protein